MYGTPWQPHEDAIILRNYATKGREYCAKRLPGRTIHMCANRARELGVQVGYLTVDKLRNRRVIPIVDVLVKVNVHPDTVRGKARRDGAIIVIGKGNRSVAYVKRDWAQAYVQKCHEQQVVQQTWINSNDVCSALGVSKPFLTRAMLGQSSSPLPQFVRSLRWKRGHKRQYFLHPEDYEVILDYARGTARRAA